MCGIAGIVSLTNDLPVDAELAGRMSACIVHRGPDDSGLYVSPEKRAALASRRLSIIDLSPAGHMPMVAADGKTWVVYNGEVYNYADYTAGLESRGIQFRGHSDTEVFVNLYCEEGPAMLRKLRGMFAMAIWNEDRRELFLARTG